MLDANFCKLCTSTNSIWYIVSHLRFSLLQYLITSAAIAKYSLLMNYFNRQSFFVRYRSNKHNSIIFYFVSTIVNDLCLYIDLIYGHLCMITKDNLGKIKTLFVCVPGDFMPSKHLRILLASPICYWSSDFNPFVWFCGYTSDMQGKIKNVFYFHHKCLWLMCWFR